jgi:hypothetical protein
MFGGNVMDRLTFRKDKRAHCHKGLKKNWIHDCEPLTVWRLLLNGKPTHRENYIFQRLIVDREFVYHGVYEGKRMTRWHLDVTWYTLDEAKRAYVDFFNTRHCNPEW